jgi:hypothetical protein
LQQVARAARHLAEGLQAPVGTRRPFLDKRVALVPAVVVAQAARL